MASPLGAVSLDRDSTPALLDAVQRARADIRLGRATWVFPNQTREGELWLHPSSASPGHIAGPLSHHEGLVPGNPGSVYDLGYRSDAYEIDDTEWVGAYLAEYLGVTGGGGLVTPINDFLGDVWHPMFSAFAATGAWTAHVEGMYRAIGCYNLPTDTIGDEIDYLVFNPDNGIDINGAPWTFWGYVGVAVYAFADEVADNVTTNCGGSSCCDGLAEFIRAVLPGGDHDARIGYSTSAPITNGCMQYHFINADPTWSGNVVANCNTTYAGAQDTTCDGFMGVGKGDAWDAWLQAIGPDWTYSDLWDEGTATLVAPGGESPPSSSQSCGGTIPEDSTGAYSLGFGLNWHVYFPAQQLGFDALLVDAILFIARMVYDHVRTNMGPVLYVINGALRTEVNPAYEEGMETARRIAAYALRIIAEQGYRVIHETGHSYLGDEHCDGWGCCLELGAQRWLCKFEAALGLPFCGYYRTEEPDDWTLVDNTGTATNCKDPSSPQYPNAEVEYTCRLGLIGTPAAPLTGAFYAASCDDPGQATADQTFWR